MFSFSKHNLFLFPSITLEKSEHYLKMDYTPPPGSERAAAGAYSHLLEIKTTNSYCGEQNDWGADCQIPFLHVPLFGFSVNWLAWDSSEQTGENSALGCQPHLQGGQPCFFTQQLQNVSISLTNPLEMLGPPPSPETPRHPPPTLLPAFWPQKSLFSSFFACPFLV